MDNYTPFLKLKSNEIMAVKELPIALKNNLIPFFDFPRKNNITATEFIKNVQSMKKKVDTHLSDINTFYLDNFDVDSHLMISGRPNYAYLLDNFSFIPVVGIDRTDEHINAVIAAKNASIIESNKIAIRFTTEDFEDFDLVEGDIEDLLDNAIDLFDSIDLVFDCRYCVALDPVVISSKIVTFVNRFKAKYTVSKIIVTGTSISVPIGETVPSKTEKTISRQELSIACRVNSSLNIYFGDYTVVGSNYSDVTIPGNVMMNVMTPKTVYSYDNYHFIIRGGALRTHPLGNQQFNSQATIIIAKPFFRGAPYSFGDAFIEEKSRGMGNGVMPGTILKPTINAHITYMLRDYIC